MSDSPPAVEGSSEVSYGRQTGRQRDAIRAGCSFLAPAALFFISAGFVTMRTGRDALFLAGDGLFAVPRAYIAQALLSVPQAMAVLWMMRRWGLRAVRVIVLLLAFVVGVAYTVFAERGDSWTMTSFFFLVPLVFSVAFSLAWLLGSEILLPLGPDALAKGMPRLAAASVLGAVVGSASARWLGPSLGPRALLGLGTALTLASLPTTLWAHRLVADPSKPTPDTKPMAEETPDASEGGARNVALLLGIATAGAVSGILVDFQFYLGAAGGGDDARVTYLANAYLALHVGSLTLQLFVTPWLTRHVGPLRLLLVLPIALSAGGSVALWSTSGFARAGLRALEGGVKQGVHRISWEQALSRFPESWRPRLKVMVDGMGVRLAEGAAAAAILAWMQFASGGRPSELQLAWVSEVSAAWLNVTLIAVALVCVTLTITLARRLQASNGAKDGTWTKGTPPPFECCPVTAAAGERLLGRVTVPNA